MKKANYILIITLFTIGSVFSQTTITNNPNTRYQTMKGWGTSLAWWANLVGGMPQASIDDISNRIAVDANLNFFRFNIGGGDNPTCPYGDHMRKDGGKMPGYRSFYANNQGFGVVNVNNDARQIRVLDKLASLRAPYGGVVTEMFSVAPPYFMTVSNCSAGAVSALNENLAPGFEDDFADYLCSVTKTLRDSHPNWNIQSIEPFNEPYSNFWAAGGNQEGCKVLANQQATVLYNVWLNQQTYGIGDIGLVASDCNTVAESRQNAYDLWLNHNNEYNGLAAICTHTYAGTAQEKASLHTEISGTGKPIWQTETGPLEWILPSGGQWWWRHYDMAYRLIEDIRNLKSEVWCNWQAMSYDDGWGLVQQTNWNENNPYQAATFKNTRSFYIYKQIANYIKVGYTQIANSDPNSMTFVSPDNNKIVVVVTNNTTTTRDYSIDLSNFQPITYFDTYRTSGDDDSGENAKLLTSPIVSQKGVLSANRIAYTAPSMSVTTFVASVEAPVSVTLNDFETVAPNNVVRYGSDLSIINNSLVNATNATSKVARIGRTTANWFELSAFDITPIAVPANTTYYLHTMVRYGAAADIAIRCDGANRGVDGTTTIRALNPYTSSNAGQWKDLIFAIPGGTTGVSVNSIVLFPDLGFENTPAVQVLNNSTSFAYIDEILISTSSTERIAVAAPTLASTLANFDGISPAVTTAFGATQALVANPYPNGGNTSANVIRIGRTSTEWYEYTKLNIPDFTLAAGETRYIHIAVNYPALPVTSIRIDVDNTSSPDGVIDILPVNTYASASNSHWQDLVFAVSGGANGLAVNNLVLLADVGNFSAPPAGQVLNNTANYAYIDNIVINSSVTPLFTARTSLQAITLFATLNTNPTPRLVDYTNAGVTGVTSTNLTAVNAAVDIANPAPTTLVAVQAIVNQTVALAVITSYASSNTNPVPTLLNYTNAGVTGVTAGNLSAVNAAIDTASPAPTTLVVVQGIVNQTVALAVITSYASSNTNPVPTLLNYTNAGVTGVTAGNLSAVNAAIDTASLAPTTLLAVQTIVTPVTALAVITSYASSNTNPVPTLLNYTNAGVTGVTAGNLSAVNAAIDTASPSPTTLVAVQGIVNQTVALAVITSYASSNANPVPTLLNYTNAGVTGVTAGNLSVVNAAIDTASPAPTILVAVQGIVNQTVALAVITSYASSNTNPLPTLANYTNAGVTGVTAGNLSAVNAAIDTASPAPTTLLAVQTVVSRVTALAIITSYASSNTNPVPTLANYTNAGVTGVTAGNLSAVNAAIDTASPAPTTLIAVQAIVTPVTALTVIISYASSNTNPVPTLANYINAGVTGVTSSNLTAVNAAIDTASPAPTTLIAVQAIVTPVTALAVITSYASSNTNPIPTVLNYTNAGVTGVTAGNLSAVNAAIDAASPAPITLVAVQGIVNQTVALAVITNYASSNTNPVPTVLNYTNAGVTGVTSTNLSAVNTAIDTASPAPTTLVSVQGIVNQTLALAVITSYASSNTNPVPTLLNYTNAGVTGVTAGNLSAVNTAIDTASPAPTTLVQVQAVVSQTIVNLSLSISINDFETVAPNNVVRYGSDLFIVSNPLVNATNATAKVARIGRTTANWYELFAFDITPVVVPANTTYYLHTMVRYGVAADVAIRYDGLNRDTDGVTPIRALNPYTVSDAGQWKDLVFAIPGGTSGVTVNAIQFHPDLGFENVPAAQVLNNTTSFAYVDELLISGTSLARTAVAAPILPSTLANFDGISPAATTAFGATQAIVANPYPNGGNTSANCTRIGRTSQNWYELTKFNIPDFTLLPNETKYIHIAVNYPALPVTSIRIDVDNATTLYGNVDILPVNTYSSASNSQWQDLIFAVSGGAKGLSVNNLILVADVGNFAAPPVGQVLNNTTNFAYIDNIIINNSQTPLFTARTSLQATPLFTARTGLDAITLYAEANTNPTPRLVDYTSAGVTGVLVDNLVAVNTAIDAASPAPTKLEEVQALVNQALANLSSVSFGINGFKLYPNPTSDTINIILESIEETNVEILNVNGQEVLEYPKLTSKQLVINIKDTLPSGFYFVKVTTGNKTQTRKVIVK